LRVITPYTRNVYTCQLHPLNSACTNFPDEFGVINAVVSRFLINVLEDREQDSGNYHPKNQVFCHIIQGFIPQWLVKFVGKAPIGGRRRGLKLNPNSNERGR
jgi:hypothetical protein